MSGPKYVNSENTEAVSFMPPGHLGLEISLQELLSKARFSNLKKISDKIGEVNVELERHVGELKNLKHRPDLIFRFWACQVEHRIVSHSLDYEGFEKVKN